MATCSFHADREAIGLCARCGEPWCYDCIRSTPTALLCVGCIAEIQQSGGLGSGVGAAGASGHHAQPGATEVPASIRPSPIFLVIVAAFVGSCVWAAQQQGFLNARWPVRAVVFSGWILSLCLHEFGHAITAYVGGDKTVASKGYLTLDPRKYAHAGLSLAMPILFLLMGGIGLPGGAVWINHSLIRKRNMRSLMSLAGPGANFICALALAIPLKLGVFESLPTLHVALAFLALLQITTMLLNLIPMPGLDGFGVLSPYLPESVIRAVAPIRQFAFIALFFALSISRFGAIFWNTADHLAALIGIPTELAEAGRELFTFARSYL